MNSYEEKQAAKRARYQELAEKAESRAGDCLENARRITGNIPFGQPILVGHHSEKKHRGALAKHDRAMGKSIEESKKAEYYARKADNVGRSGISSDDPEAVTKLREKLANLERSRDRMKAVNAAYRKAGKPRGGEFMAEDGAKWDKFKQLAEIGDNLLHECQRTLTVSAYLKTPYPSFELTNIGANIRRIKGRIKDLEASSGAVYRETTFPGGRIVENPEENRVQIFHDEKPAAEIRAMLKRNGFRWSPSNMAWQRHLNAAGRYHAGLVCGVTLAR